MPFAHANGAMEVMGYQYDYDRCGLTDYFVKTDAYDGGLTEQLAQRAIQIINA